MDRTQWVPVVLGWSAPRGLCPKAFMLRISGHLGCAVGSQTVGEPGMTLYQVSWSCQGLRPALYPTLL